MKGSRKVQRALGHTKADLVEHLRLDHGVKVSGWGLLTFNDLKRLHHESHGHKEAR